MPETVVVQGLWMTNLLLAATVILLTLIFVTLRKGH